MSSSNELLESLALSLEHIMRTYGPKGIQAARSAIEKASGSPPKNIVEDLLALTYLERTLAVSAETARALKEEISREALLHISGVFPDSGEYE